MVSAIDPTKPADGDAASKAELRANLRAAKDEIEALQGGKADVGHTHTLADIADLADEDGGGGPLVARTPSGWVDATARGVANDGTGAQQAAIEAAAAAAAERGKALYLPAGTYRITDTCTLDEEIDLFMEGRIEYAGRNDRPALVIGGPPGDSHGRRIVHGIEVVNASGSDWASADNVGVRLRQFNACTVYVRRVHGFTVGVQCYGDGAGFGYTRVELGALFDNQVGLELNAVNGGWVNENLFLNGRFSVFSRTNNDRPRYGVRIWSGDGTYPQCNSNYFLKPSFELSAEKTTGETVPIVCTGPYNEWVSCRNESGLPQGYPFARFIGRLAIYNIVRLGYHPVTRLDASYLDERDGAKWNGIISRRQEARNLAALGGFSS